MAFKSEELEELYIPNIISTLKKKNDVNLDALFSGAVAANLANQGLSALQISSKIQISHYLSSIQSQFNNKNNKQLAIQSPITNRGITIPQSSGMWLEASALVNAASYADATKYIGDYLNSTPKSDYEQYITGFSNSTYMKQAFASEPILIDFKNSNPEFYENTVGMPTR